MGDSYGDSWNGAVWSAHGWTDESYSIATTDEATMAKSSLHEDASFTIASCEGQGQQQPQCATYHLSSASSHKLKARLVKLKRKGNPDGPAMDPCSEADRQMMFSMADADESGLVSMAELEALMGPHAAAAMAAIDTNVDGMISYEEFAAFAVCVFCSEPPPPQCANYHLSSASGHKLKARLVKLKRKGNPDGPAMDPCSEADRQMMFSMADADESGLVSMAELEALT